ncbi:UNVERIFIED_CONTAM: hypothetical protein Sradi_3179600 [Sesamum radiatum]|uniref:Uncharacterized protein n=1 Tax=Sesamum radiatum TaxID=300843 RepID=A0AAW2RFC5_SESRA
MIRQCRVILRGCSRFHGDDFMFLNPKVPDDEGDEDREVEVVDVLAGGDAQVNGSEVPTSEVDKA